LHPLEAIVSYVAGVDEARIANHVGMYEQKIRFLADRAILYVCKNLRENTQPKLPGDFFDMICLLVKSLVNATVEQL